MGLGGRSTAQDVVRACKADLRGATFVVTGGNSGLGQEAVRVLAGAGARVVLACRNTAKGDAAAEAIRSTGCKGTVVVKQLDLADLSSVRRCAADIAETEDAPQGLILNAGIMIPPLQRTKDGFESQIGCNHLGHFAFAAPILKKMVKQGKPCRVVSVSSDAYLAQGVDTEDLNWEKRPYTRWGAYGASKTANLLFTQELARRLQGTQVTTYAVHPGLIPGSGLFWAQGTSANSLQGRLVTAAIWPFTKSVPQGAATEVYAALAPGIESKSGGFFKNCGHASIWRPHGRDAAAASRLWTLSEELTGTNYGL